MTHLQTMMIEELVRRNYSGATRECDIRAVKEFAVYFKCPPDKLGLEHIRIFQAHLFSDRKLSPNTVNQHLAALRFFFVKTLHRPWNTAETPYPKRVIRLPKVLSPGGVALLIDSAIIPFHRVMLMTLYATGVRRAELANLRVSDIDSKRMVIRIQGGKGLKDREVILSKVLLEALREHWPRHRPKVRSAFMESFSIFQIQRRLMPSFTTSTVKTGSSTASAHSAARNMFSNISAATHIEWPFPTIG